MHSPVCAICRVEMKPQRNGVVFLQKASFSAGGEVTPYPYALFMGDQWACKSCGHSAIIGWGQKAIARRHDKGFEQLVEKYRELDSEHELFIEEDFERGREVGNHA